MYASTELSLSSSSSTLVVECLTAKLGLLKVHALGAKDIILEGDCILIINFLKNNINLCDWSIKCNIQDCKDFALEFSSISYTWVKRTANSPTHHRDTKSLSISSSLDWNFQALDWLEIPLLLDSCNCLGATLD